MPAFLQAFASSGSIWREASLMSVLPSQKSTNPSPVPGPSTETCASGLLPAKCSATSCEIGSTVEEPETATEPESPDVPLVPTLGVSLLDAHAAATSATTDTARINFT